jgi:hypothetical protein
MATSADPTADQSQSTKPIKNSRLSKFEGIIHWPCKCTGIYHSAPGAVVPQNEDTN